jgi:hypothetical protein
MVLFPQDYLVLPNPTHKTVENSIANFIPVVLKTGTFPECEIFSVSGFKDIFNISGQATVQSYSMSHQDHSLTPNFSICPTDIDEDRTSQSLTDFFNRNDETLAILLVGILHRSLRPVSG